MFLSKFHFITVIFFFVLVLEVITSPTNKHLFLVRGDELKRFICYRNITTYFIFFLINLDCNKNH